MIPPVRCFTCGIPLSAIWYELNGLCEEEKRVKMLQRTSRYCCRMQLTTTSDLTMRIKSCHTRTESEKHVMDFEATITVPREVDTL
jgi:DNA-directed RNA polymerase subunit N (RpoN/RPB10)